MNLRSGSPKMLAKSEVSVEGVVALPGTFPNLSSFKRNDKSLFTLFPVATFIDFLGPFFPVCDIFGSIACTESDQLRLIPLGGGKSLFIFLPLAIFTDLLVPCITIWSIIGFVARIESVQLYPPLAGCNAFMFEISISLDIKKTQTPLKIVYMVLSN